MEIFTIGFTQRTAASFFTTLEQAGIERLVDVRRHNTSQLAGFAKRDDLAWFLDRILGAEYVHRPEAAPTSELLASWRAGDLAWEDFATSYRDQIATDRIDDLFSPDDFARPTVLLCSERDPDHCHRRLLVEHLDAHWGDVAAHHL
ncbi:DUF488 domain-containing protein [Nitriliruptoria bacterium AS10]|nr:DUF488 domain-containing protein [Salsipaludibacter albus]